MRFQIVDTDYVLNPGPVIRLFGRNEEGDSVCCFYEGFEPYFYVKGSEEKVLKFLKDRAEVANIEQRKKFPAIGYHKEPVEVLKITVKKPEDVPALREHLMREIPKLVIYESDIFFRYRFMIDKGICGLDWIDVDEKRIETKTVNCRAFQITSIKKDEKEENADMKYMSFDIECLPKDTTRPLDSSKDPIIMISMAFSHKFRAHRTVVMVAKNIKTERKNVMCFSSEEDMLNNFIKIMNEYDPDILTGYNIQNFDIPYILERFKNHNIRATIGRCCTKEAKYRKVGLLEQCTIPGRVVFDPYQALRNDPNIRFRQYDLNTVAKEMLGEEKIDIKYKEMAKYWNGSADMLDKFILYTEKDADMALRIVVEKNIIAKFLALAKLSGLLLQDTFGGQSIRVETKLMHEFKKRGILMPSRPTKEEAAQRNAEREKLGLKGATVLEPKKGLHTDGCTLVLDFKSLYPSIIRTYNISPETLITGKTDEKSISTVTGAKFIDTSIYEGTIPRVLKDLLDMRNKVKKEMRSAKGDRRAALDATQYGIKILANSFYGYTGFAMARLYVLDIASAITGIGRENLQTTKEMIEKKFGYIVIYADTDSVFLETKITKLDEAKKVGEEVSKHVSENLPGYLELDFEKILRTFLILTKKRYAGWSFESTPEGWKDKIIMKGIETVRRDWCPLVSETMNEILILILKKGDIKGATEYVKDIIKKLKKNEVPLEKLTIVKGLTKHPETYKGMLPHIELAKKMLKRKPENPPHIGDRIGFVIISGNSMLSKRAEDPEYVSEKKLNIDSEYYINNQLLPAIERILTAVGITKTELMGGGYQASIFDAANGKGRKSQHEIEIEYDKKEDRKVLDGWEEFMCEKCKKSHRRMPLSGLCSCGGKIKIFYQGSVADKCKQ